MQYQPTPSNYINNDFVLALSATIIGTLGVWYIHSMGLIQELTDSYAHLNFAKLMFESLTPGISQVGFWPPLLHLLMAPFTLVPSLYESGLAGAIVILPFYVLGTVYTYKTLKLFTKNDWLSLIGAVMFMVNPYILYYSSVPMMEVLFLGNLMAVGYYISLWFIQGRLSALVLTAVFVTLAALSRFEGLFLAPVVALILAIDLFRRRKEFIQIQAVLVLFLLIALIGPLVIVSYSWYFGGSPIAFTGGSWIRSATEKQNFLTQGSYVESIRYLFHAAYYMVGKNLIIFALVAFPFLALVNRRRYEIFSLLLVLATPVIFIVIALASGSYNVGVPDLPPGTVFLNERYGLSWIGFAIIAPLLLFGGVLQMSQSSKKYLNYAAKTAVALGCLALMYSTAEVFYATAVDDKYFVIRNNINSPRSYHKELAAYLHSKHDFGKVLITRSDNDPVLFMSQIPLDGYIYEANYLYFKQALDEPWIFARWVVMDNNDGRGFGRDAGTTTDEAVAVKWRDNEQFEYYYELMYENQARKVYKVRDDRVIEHANLNNLDLAKIPSINQNLTRWDPAEFYEELRIGYDVKKN